MTQTTTIDGVSRTSVVKRNRCEWVEHAYLGEIGSGTLVIHDDAGSISVTGHKTIVTSQDACSSWPRIYTGFVGSKQFSRGETYYTGAGREITVSTKDGNDLLTRYIIWDTDGKRPAETVAARVAWILGSTYLTGLVNDYGRITSVTTLGMDATDYRGQRPGDVLAACAKKANFNYYVRWSYSDAGFELVFRDDNTQTADTSSISITNDGTADSTSSFAPFHDAVLTEDPEDVYSNVYATYAKGVITATRAATATAFVTRWGTTDDSGIKTAAQANDQADDFLWQSHTDEHTLTLTIRMRAAYVGLVRAGQRISVKLTHLATQGYDSATYFQILRRTVRQALDTDNDYDVQLDLSPQEAGPPTAAIVQSASGHVGEGGGTLSLPNPVTVGSDLFFFISDRGIPNPTGPSTSSSTPRWGAGAWTKVPNNNADNGSDGIAWYHKVADSTEQTGYTGSSNCAIGIFEVQGGDYASIQTLYLDNQTATNPMTLGTFSSIPAGSVALFGGNWSDSNEPPPDPADPSWTGAANGWTTDLLYWERGTFPYWGPPISYIAHQISDGSNVVCSGTRGPIYWMSGSWCAAALLIPPL